MRTTIDLPDDLHRIVTSLARHTGRSAEQLRADLDRDLVLTSREAVDYGLVDDVIVQRSGVRQVA